MLTIIEQALPKAQALSIGEQLRSASWESGQATAGMTAAQVKANLQLPVNSELAQQLGHDLREHLLTLPDFISAALPNSVLKPRFNCYTEGGYYGTHVDSALMKDEHNQWLRTDISATLFFSEPDQYEGGELMIETAFGAQSVKLEAGDMVLYPSSSLHQVTPVTQGARIAAFFWVQSLVKDHSQRALLFDLDRSIQSLTAELGAQHPQVAQLSGIYHNLLRENSET